MADVIIESAMQAAFIVAGFMIFCLPLVAVFFLRDKIPFARKIYHLRVFEGEMDGDTLNIGKEILKTKCWIIKKNHVQMIYAQKTFMREGFNLDLSYLAYVIDFEGKPTIRCAQLSKGVWKAGKFIPIGSPDAKLVDSRTVLFSEKISSEREKKSVTALQQAAWNDLKEEERRAENNQLMKLLEMAAPVIMGLLVIVSIFFVTDFYTKSMDKNAAINLEALKIAHGEVAPPKNVTQNAPQPSNVAIPFMPA